MPEMPAIGLRTKVFLEFVALTGVLILLGAWLTPEDPLLIKVPLHPFWAVVLLVAVRYGFPAGALAGGACGAIFALGLWQSGYRLAAGIHLGDLTLAQPILLLLVGWLIGESVEKRIKQREFLQQQLEEWRRKETETEMSRASLENAYRQLEGRMAGHTGTVASLYESARQLGSYNPEGIYTALEGILRAQLPIEQCGVWVADQEGQFRRSSAGGVAPDEPLPALGRLALRERCVVSALNLSGDAAPEDGVLAGLLKRDDGSAAAVVVVRSMRFAGYVPTTVRLFELLLQWASQALSQAQAKAERSGLAQRVQQADLISEALLKERGADYLRGDEPVAVLAFRPRENLTPQVWAGLSVVLARLSRILSSPRDSVAYVQESDTLVLLLPGTGAEGAEAVRRKLEREVAAFHFEALELQWGLAARHAGDDFPGLLRRALGAAT